MQEMLFPKDWRLFSEWEDLLAALESWSRILKGKDEDGKGQDRKSS